MTYNSKNMNCRTCEYRMKYNKGCYKFGVSFKEIDSGVLIFTTIKHETIKVGLEPCPYARIKNG